MHHTQDLREVLYLVLSSLAAFILSFKRHVPLSHVKTPALVSHNLPFLGHVVPFLASPTRFLAKCRARYGAIFKISLDNNHMVMLSSPKAILSVQIKSRSDIGPFDHQRLRAVSGLPQSRVSDLFDILHRDAFRIATNQLSPRRIADFTASTPAHLFSNISSCVPHDVHSFTSFDMHTLIAQTIYRASILTFFGQYFPDTFKDFIALDDNMFACVADIPWLRRPGCAARDALASKIHTFLRERWVADEDGGHLDGASQSISDTVKSLKRQSVLDEEIARLLTVMLWGIHGNMIQIATWLMLYLLGDPLALDRVRRAVRETYPAATFDVQHLSDDFQDVPILGSALKETLRLTLMPITVRVALRDITVTGEDGTPYAVRKGEQIMLDVRGMHLDEKYHANAQTFQVHRFMDAQAGYVDANGVKTFVPWGAGMYMCKGREYAQRVIKLFFIMFFHLYDVEPSTTPLPGFKPWSLSVVHPTSLPAIRLRRRGAAPETAT